MLLTVPEVGISCTSSASIYGKGCGMSVDTESERWLFPLHYIGLVESMISARHGDTSQVYTCIGLTREAIQQQPDRLLTLSQFKSLISLCIDNLRLNSELRFEQILHYLPVTAHGLIGMACMTADTMGEALDMALRYFPLLLPAFELSREDLSHEAHIYIKRNHDFGSTANELLTELIVGSIGRMAQFASGTKLNLQGAVKFRMKVQFSHPSTESLDRFAAHFGSPVMFDGLENKFVVAREVLDQPVLTSNAATRMTLEALLDQQMQARPKQFLMSRRVRAMLKQALLNGQVLSAAEIASELAMSVRTLSRRLSDDGVSLSSLIEEVRIERADLLLTSSDLPLIKMSQQLGYSDIYAFSRAFKRVKGYTPSELRKNLLDAN